MQYQSQRRRFAWRSLLTGALTVAFVLLGHGMAQAEELPAGVPPESVVASLSGFPTDPAAAMSAWTQWVATSPMTYVRNSPSFGSRSKCRIDSAQISRCTDYQEVIGRGGRNMGMKPVSEVVTSGTGRQYFRDIPMKKWTSNKYGANANPITNTSRFYSYDPWQPWLTPGITYTTSVDSDGTLVIRSEVANPRDDQPPVTVARVAASGTQAVLQDRNRANKALSTTTITFTAVPAITFPPRK